MGSPVTWQINPNFNWTGEQPIAQARPTASNQLQRGGAAFGTGDANQMFGTPSSLPSSGAGGFDLNKVVDAISGGAGGGVTNQDIIKALTPVQQAAPMQMPAYFQQRTENPPPARMQTGAVGAGAARGQGVGNAISASVGALATFKATRDRNKQEADANRVSRFIQAQEGMDQAKQIVALGPNTPGYQQAQQALQQNQSLMQGMLADQKFVKTLEKGFNVSLTDPSQNKTPEHGIVQRGIDLFRQGKQGQQPFTPEQQQAIMQRFQAQRPQMMAPSPQAIQQLQMRQALGKDQSALMKAILPSMIREQAASERATETQNRIDRRTNFTQGNENQRAYAKILNDWNLNAARQDDKISLAKLNYTLRVQAAEKILSNRLATPEALQAEKFKVDHNLTAEEQRQQASINTLNTNLIAYKSTGNAQQAEVKRMEDAIKEQSDVLTKMKDDHKTVLNQFDDQITGKVRFDGKPGSDSGQPSTEQPVKSPRADVGGGTGTQGIANSLANASTLQERLSLLGLGNTEDSDTEDESTDSSNE